MPWVDHTIRISTPLPGKVIVVTSTTITFSTYLIKALHRRGLKNLCDGCAVSFWQGQSSDILAVKLNPGRESIRSIYWLRPKTDMSGPLHVNSTKLARVIGLGSCRTVYSLTAEIIPGVDVVLRRVVEPEPIVGNRVPPRTIIHDGITLTELSE